MFWDKAEVSQIVRTTGCWLILVEERRFVRLTDQFQKIDIVLLIAVTPVAR